MSTIARPEGLLVAVVVMAFAAWALRWLTLDGAIAAALVGGAVALFGGIRWAAVLLAFFATGTLLTFLGRHRKTHPEHRGRGRTAWQVAGTGGVAAVVSVIWGAGVGPGFVREVLPAAFLGAIAAAAADTWSAEIGMLSPRRPRMITTWAPVPSGTSGGVTVAGSLAGVAGAVLIAAIGTSDARVFTAAWIAGVVAMFGDSVIGATIQATFRRPNGSIVEDPAGAVPLRGIPWMTNPVVNLFATAAGALLAAGLVRLL
ncbi:MAG: DUF92 domain-containing protein [Pseudomonadota bacterium]